uniref:Hypothetical chloroplast protein 174 n=1 Tax=Pyropia perforata TaxID=182771 RepID=A0A023HR43_PYRPE|nr:hypothetical chloroplast protein 174 [Neoporphyra perforata]AGQ17034.1 hypothetical chloroplast protein 174 [Neoporphyra perforata]AHB34970.1 hypothetical chloroplast protein 174 [Neoporphyra perforata]AHB35179.1 hypothetical chloroplast protein 174 [Neoporphyra perforata]AIA19341.1 hypothetical protein [Neoporphyra perforata]AIA19550.1 hypothetical protein [Neoporphyra perforata]
MIFWKSFFQNSHINSNSEKNFKKLIVLDNTCDKVEFKDIYLSSTKNINLYELEQLCDSVGWVKRPLKKVKIALKNSSIIISLVEKKDTNTKLVGFARATSDNGFNATIWDVVIHPDFQGLGLGKVVIHQLIQQLRQAEISTITLFAEPDVVSFYKKLGFIKDPDGVKGMFWYPR